MFKNKFKKIIIATGVLAMSSSIAFAGAAPYVGAALGVNTMTSTSGNNFRSMPLDLFAGFGAKMNASFYLGGEITATPLSALLSKSPGNVLRTTYSYGISIMPGAMFSDHTVGYVRVGVVRSRFNFFDETKTGGQVGAGIQTDVMPDLSLRTEYVYSWYSKSRYASWFNNTVITMSPKSDAFKVGLIYKFE
ncbi:MAG: hypothetical protein K0S63_305 [Gammaproteobacteria bacterium]|nr:hypothetical protein [Gammaproteobacteria bacterium]